jgi:NAD(P)-dependent dehydrogenase (short-subunit alcohol dehydrogenase family)
VLINNAGVFLDRNATADNVAPELLAQTLEVNLMGVLRVTQALIPSMKSHEYGRIVNVSSSMGCLTEMGSRHPAYRISKTALNALTRVLAADLMGSNILVNAVCPGWVQTEMGGPRADRPVEEAIDTILWLAALPNRGPTGGLFRDRQRLPW